MDKEYITIKEYADIRGVSVSSVYKRLDTTLKEYLVEVENHKALKIDVLADEGLKPLKKVEEGKDTSSSTILEKQLEAKDKQIEALTEQIKTLQESNQKKDDFIQEQSKKLTELLEQSNILLQNNQLLLANKKKDEKETVVEEADIVDAPEEEEKQEDKPEEKKGWFQRLFR